MRKLSILFIAIVIISLTSCMSFAKPDGINNTLIYGYMDTSSSAVALNRGHILTVFIVPWDTEFVEEKEFGMHGITYNLEGYGMYEELRYDSPVMKNLFVFQNYEPGYYYLGLLQHRYGNIVLSIKIPKPESKEQGILVDKDQLIYLGAYYLDEDYNILPNNEVSQEEATDILESWLSNSEWYDFIVSHR